MSFFIYSANFDKKTKKPLRNAALRLRFPLLIYFCKYPVGKAARALPCLRLALFFFATIKGRWNMARETRTSNERTLREEARRAKSRIKSGFWLECKEDLGERLEKARQQGLNESKAERYFTEQVSVKIAGNKEDEFYLKVKELLLSEGEVSNAIGRLTDENYYQTLSYEEKQRYTLSLSEKYLRALERFRRECEFEPLDKNA